MNNKIEKIYNTMCDVLEENYYSFTTDAVKKIINTWETNKSNLIDLLSKHPNWNDEKKMIQFDTDFKRDVDKVNANKFFNYIERTDEELLDTFWHRANKHLAHIKRLTTELGNGDIIIKHNYAWHIEVLNEIMPELHAKVGEKTTRVIGRICKIMEWDKLENFNKEYAKYCDAMSTLQVKRHTVLSVNPIDYLYMSNGNSWHSCHDIRDADSCGCYSSGTISYMLDGVSMIFYTVDKEYDGDSIELESKIQRQVFCYDDGQLLQSRLYPSANDGNTEQYDNIRAIVQKIIADCENAPNLWVKKSKWKVDVDDNATLYPDWNCNTRNAFFTVLKSKSEMLCDDMIVGHAPICIECGEYHGENENINCCRLGCACADCGTYYDPEEMIYIDGEYYCTDCAHYCEYCEEWYIADDCHWLDSCNGYVCDHCLENYFVYCEPCDEYYHHEDVVYSKYDNCYICKWCAESYYTYCEYCNDYIPNEYISYVESVNEDVCDNCLERYFTECDECGELMLDDENHKHEIINEETGEVTFLCEYCYAKKNTESNSEVANND